MKLETLKNIFVFLERDARPQGMIESYALVEAHQALKQMLDAMQPSAPPAPPAPSEPPKE